MSAYLLGYLSPSYSPRPSKAKDSARRLARVSGRFAVMIQPI